MKQWFAWFYERLALWMIFAWRDMICFFDGHIPADGYYCERCGRYWTEKGKRELYGEKSEEA